MNHAMWLMVLVCFGLPSQAAAQFEALRPSWKRIDKWVYYGSKGWFKTYKADKVMDDYYEVEVTDFVGKKLSPIFMDLDLNIVEGGVAEYGIRYGRKVLTFDWPLKIGKTYGQYGPDGKNPDIGARSCKVEGNEQVQVKAGTFEAFRVRCVGVVSEEWYGHKRNGKRDLTIKYHRKMEMVWYAPAAKAAVRIDIEETPVDLEGVRLDPRVPANSPRKQSVELVSFELH